MQLSPVVESPPPLRETGWCWQKRDHVHALIWREFVGRLPGVKLVTHYAKLVHFAMFNPADFTLVWLTDCGLSSTERVKSTTGVLQPGTINFPNSMADTVAKWQAGSKNGWQRPSSKKKGEGKSSGTGTDWLSLRNPGWMRGEGEEGWTEGGFRKRKQSNCSWSELT